MLALGILVPSLKKGCLKKEDIPFTASYSIYQRQSEYENCLGPQEKLFFLEAKPSTPYYVVKPTPLYTHGGDKEDRVVIPCSSLEACRNIGMKSGVTLNLGETLATKSFLTTHTKNPADYLSIDLQYIKMEGKIFQGENFGEAIDERTNEKLCDQSLAQGWLNYKKNNTLKWRRIFHVYTQPCGQRTTNGRCVLDYEMTLSKIE